MSNREEKDKLSIRDIRELIKAKDIAGIIKVGKDLMLNSQVWRSFFRHGLEDTPKTRAQTVISNAFLHLHPAKIKRHATLFKFTWCMGGITFFTFLVLTITGVFLMFYYHPNVRDAYWDMKGLEYHVPFGLPVKIPQK